jgi:L-lactate dehydrogenase complex protein LldF
MSSEFRRRARQAIANPNLQAALDRNADLRMDVWEKSFASLPDYQSLRQHAHRIRREVIENLEVYVEKLCQRLEFNGFLVHRATSAKDANDRVVEIAKQHSVDLVVKSKSMLTEEIGLNHAVIQAGIRVVETDLGEFIVQLRGEPPAHIITPAVHLRREDVAETFERELGVPYSTDVEDMNEAARVILRAEFLEAQMGVSGVNFGVAETGTLCLVTNEGNGRMVTTLPPVHVAIMGVERIVPTLEDLDLMLRLLPRSATGQKLSSYVSLIQGPRRTSEPDGPNERHIILVDNGRSVLAGTDLAEALLCIRCGACLNICPVFREIGGHAFASAYPGPIGSVISPGLLDMEQYGHLANASTLCGACRDVCPVMIDLSGLISRTRHIYVESGKKTQVKHWVMSFYAWIMGSSARYRGAQKVAAWFSRMLPKKSGWLRSLPPPFAAWTMSRDFPPFAVKPFRERFEMASPVEQFEEGFAGQIDEPSSIPVSTPQNDLVTLFGEELSILGGTFIRSKPERAPDEVVTQLQNHNIRQIIAWETNDQLVQAVLRRITDGGIEILEPGVPPTSGREPHLEKLGAAGAGLTGAVAGWADTGTLVVPGGEGRSQLASLLPPVHVALLSAGFIYRDMGDWLRAGGAEVVREVGSINFISGPSRTADIEMTLTIGVHGPGTLIVICLE